MKIETKFNPGDSVWCIRFGSVIEITIQNITICIRGEKDNSIQITYMGKSSKGLTETEIDSKVYATKEECALSWVKQQGLNIDLNGTLIEDHKNINKNKNKEV
jgi:hypothetical protein